MPPARDRPRTGATARHRKSSREHPLLAIGVLDPLAGDVEILGLDLDANELAAEIGAGDASRARAHERVEDQSGRYQSDDPRWKLHGLFRLVAAWSRGCPGDRPNVRCSPIYNGMLRAREVQYELVPLPQPVQRTNTYPV